MKVSGPKGPAAPPPPAEPAADKPQSTSPSSFAELLTSPPATPAGVGPLQAAFADIHARLRAGEIDAKRASELLVDVVVRAQLPLAAPRLQAELRETLQRLLRDDPVLAAKLRQLAEE